ncbi:MAG: hypothetical protein ACXVZX_00795, partial [Terriglobales bacterium]
TTNAFVLDLKDTSVQAGNDLTLRGTMADGKITGQWGLASTDVNCSGFGTFTMTKVGSPYPSRGGH